MNLNNVPISVLVITCIWLAVISVIFITKYRSRYDDQFMDTERRKAERRSEDEESSDSAIDSEQEKRRASDRQNQKDWKTDYREIRERVEHDTSRKDL